MKDPRAEALDICMGKMFEFIKNEHAKDSKNVSTSNTYKLLMDIFEKIILPTHNSHHIQFIMFYYCSFKVICDKLNKYKDFIKMSVSSFF